MKKSLTKKRQKKNGFTVLELLLYIGLFSIILLGVSAFLYLLLSARVKHETMTEVEQQGAIAMQWITQAVRNAEEINNPSRSNTADTLTLELPTDAQDPTEFRLRNGALTTREDDGAEIALTSNDVTVSSVQFTNTSLANTPGSVRIQFTITHVNTSGRFEYTYAKTFYAAASLR